MKETENLNNDRSDRKSWNKEVPTNHYLSHKKPIKEDDAIL